MTNLTRRDGIRLFAFGALLLLLPGTSLAQRRLPPIAEQVADTYGVASFGKIDAIRYTFNVERSGAKFSRSWEWDPKTDTVSYAGKNKEGKILKVTYRRAQLGHENAVVKKIDSGFINDVYWLLLPLHLVWDGSATVTDAGMHKLPLGTGSAELVVMKYPSTGGYAPGDTWEFYVGADKRVQQIIYRRGGTGEPRIVVATWGDQKEAGPLLIAMDHRGTADGKPVRVSFSDVSVKLSGSENWIDVH